MIQTEPQKQTHRIVLISHRIPVEELESMAETTALGIGYWAAHIEDDKFSEFEEVETGEDAPFNYGIKLTGKKFELNGELIAKGIENMAMEGSPGWYSIAKYVIGNEGGADIDACDALVQYGVFGDLVYG